jgi:hypothetical protein
MRTPVCVVLTILVSTLSQDAAAQTDSLSALRAEAHAHILQVADAYEATPGGYGLLRIALAEAEIVALHADLAAEAVNSLDDVRLHVDHMLHALDPAFVFSGPGLGYGLRRAVDEARLRIDSAAVAGAQSDNVRMHTAHISSALANTSHRADEILSLAQEILLSTSAAGVGSLLSQLTVASTALLPGQDADRDGLIGWQPGEGGLRQATWHMTLLKRGEGLLGQP